MKELFGVVGLDLSLKQTGVCYVPPGWCGNVDDLRVSSIKTKRGKDALGDLRVIASMEMERCLEIAEFVIDFVRENGASHVAKEHYAMSPVRNKKGQPVQSASITRLAELNGVVLSQLLLACGIGVVPVVASSARKFVTGGLKRGNPKEQVDRFLQSHGVRFCNQDEMDAFVVAYARYGVLNGIRSIFLPQSEFSFDGFE